MDHAPNRIDVIDPQPARLGDPQAREGAQQDSRPQMLGHRVVQRPDLLGPRDVALRLAHRWRGPPAAGAASASSRDTYPPWRHGRRAVAVTRPSVAWAATARLGRNPGHRGLASSRASEGYR